MYPERYDEINFFNEWKNMENVRCSALQTGRESKGTDSNRIRNRMRGILRRILKRNADDTQICIENA